MKRQTDAGFRARRSLLWVAASLVPAVSLSVALDAVVALGSREAPATILANIVLFNGGAILQASVGAVIEWRRPGHRVGRLLMITGPMYAGLAVLWGTVDELALVMGPQLEGIVGIAGVVLSYAGVALMIAGLPLIFPTGTLPGPRWRRLVVALSGLFAAGLLAMATRPGTMLGTTMVNPLGIEGWPPLLQPLVDAIPLGLVALVLVGLISLIARYRGGDQVVRHQLRWFASAVAVILLGFTGVVIERAVRTDTGPLVSGMVAYAGILLMPVAVGVAVLRYRLYDIDRLISRGLSWGLLTGILVAVYAGGVLVMQGALAGVTQGQTLAVAASTLLAAALFQPLRRRLQHVVDRRFDRAAYDAELTVTAFAARLRDQVDLASLERDIEATVVGSLRPGSAALWVRPTTSGRWR
jgi:hypothetical protein